MLLSSVAVLLASLLWFLCWCLLLIRKLRFGARFVDQFVFRCLVPFCFWIECKVHRLLCFVHAFCFWRNTAQQSREGKKQVIGGIEKSMWWTRMFWRAYTRNTVYVSVTLQHVYILQCNFPYVYISLTNYYAHLPHCMQLSNATIAIFHVHFTKCKPFPEEFHILYVCNKNCCTKPF